MGERTDICGVEHAKWLDNRVRRLLHNPRRLFRPYIKEGDTVLDIGCGPGAFTLDLAEMVGNGKVIAIDLQEEMLAIVRKKAEAAGILNRITLHRCGNKSLDISVQADFILTFYMVHEHPEPMHLIDQICSLLKNGGYYYLSEPKFHVTGHQFREVVNRCIRNGLDIVMQGGFFSRTVVFKKKED